MLKSCINIHELPAAAMVQKASFKPDIDAATASSNFKAATAEPREAQQTGSEYPLLKDRRDEGTRLARPWVPGRRQLQRQASLGDRLARGPEKGENAGL